MGISVVEPYFEGVVSFVVTFCKVGLSVFGTFVVVVFLSCITTLPIYKIFQFVTYYITILYYMYIPNLLDTCLCMILVFIVLLLFSVIAFLLYVIGM